MSDEYFQGLQLQMFAIYIGKTIPDGMEILKMHVNMFVALYGEKIVASDETKEGLNKKIDKMKTDGAFKGGKPKVEYIPNHPLLYDM